MASIRGRRGGLGVGSSHRDFGNRTEQGIDSYQPLNVERGVGAEETSNTEEAITGKYRTIDGED
jgi:hypothetical protein